MIECIITGVVCFIAGFFIAAKNKDNITIGFGNKTTTKFYKDGKLED